MRSSVLFLIFLGLFFWTYILPVPTATRDYRMVSAFDSDEAMCMEIIREAIDAERPVQQMIYGDLYFNVVHHTVLYIGKFQPITPHLTILVLRSVSSFFAFICLFLLFALTRQITSDLYLPWIVMFVIGLCYSDFFLHAFNAHPDTMQLAFILGTLWILIKSLQTPKQNWLWLSFMGAALVFSTKFHGLFLLPLIALVTFRVVFQSTARVSISLDILSLISLVFLAYYTQESYVIQGLDSNHEKIVLLTQVMGFIHLGFYATLFLKLIFLLLSYVRKNLVVLQKINSSLNILSIGFVLAVGIVKYTSPEQTKDFQFMLVLFDFMEIITQGHWFAHDFNPLDWLLLISRVGVGSPVLTVLFFLFFLKFIYDIFKLKKWPNTWVLWTWVLINLIYILVRIRAGFDHYVLPFMPLVWLLSIVGVYEWIKDRSKIIKSVVILISFVVVCYSGFHTFTLRHQFLSREQDDRILMGQWMLQTIPKDSKVMADYYVYVPVDFLNYKECWGMDGAMVQDYNPDVIILSSLSKRFDNVERSADFLRGKSEDFIQRHQFYQNLRANKYAYHKIKESGDIQIFIKSKEN